MIIGVTLAGFAAFRARPLRDRLAIGVSGFHQLAADPGTVGGRRSWIHPQRRRRHLREQSHQPAGEQPHPVE